MTTFLNILAEQGRLSTHSEVMLELPNASGLNDLYIFITLLHMGELRGKGLKEMFFASNTRHYTL